MNHIKKFNEEIEYEGGLNTEYIHKFCKDRNIEEYEINDDGSLTIPAEHIQKMSQVYMNGIPKNFSTRKLPRSNGA